ncbi:hypothetical protein PoB_006973700 [Plakobranchus ocellatus]|uniref:Uncharacterized protein n=1 Tax=Plakobranchus ocellatus TaxID=259542 RepID=A0AAV4DG85_9GAST|nr:hypothetical protein PoB_006973700 [Plakobranchus ocellatus]
MRALKLSRNARITQHSEDHFCCSCVVGKFYRKSLAAMTRPRALKHCQQPKLNSLTIVELPCYYPVAERFKDKYGGPMFSNLEKIKEEARHFAELPETEFNALVLQARTFSLAPGRRSFPIPYNSSSSSMSGPQKHHQHTNNSNSTGGWSASDLGTLADDTLRDQNGLVEVTIGDNGAILTPPSMRHGGCGIGDALQQQQRPHQSTFTSSSPKHGAYDPGRYCGSSSPITSSARCVVRGDKEFGTDIRLVDHDDYKLDLDPATTSSADEDSGLPRSSSSHKASSDGPYNSFLSDESQDGDEHDDNSSIFNHRAVDGEEEEEEVGNEEERQSLLRGGRKSRKAYGDCNERPRERSLVRVTATYPNPPYDEEVGLNTSTGSSEYVESPRSDDLDVDEKAGAYSNISSKSYDKYGEMEMDVIAFRETPHATGRRSPSPSTSLNVHKHLYANQRLEGEVWDYSENSRRCEDDNRMDDDDFHQSSRPEGIRYDNYHRGRGTASGGMSTSTPFAASTQVDAKIPFLGHTAASSAMAYSSAQYSYNLQPDLGASSAAVASRKAKTRKGRSKGKYS